MYLVQHHTAFKRQNPDSNLAIFLWFQSLLLKTWNFKKLAPWKESYNKPRQHIKKERHHFADKDLYSQSYGFSSSRVQMWEFNHKGWAPKNWCHQTAVLEKSLRVPWTARRPNQSLLKEINPEYSLEGQMLKLKFQYFGHLGKDWCWDKLKSKAVGCARGWVG